ncbi:MAG: PQQ-binding-like beta-propeller repeat protein [Candidatus Bathyarchaeia archaeon]
MKNLKNKTSAIIALTLTITFAVLTASTSVVNAVIVEVDTFAWVMVAPNPVGVNQQVLVTAQIDKVSPTAVGVYGGDHFKGVTVTITKPDGTTETKGPFELWAMSNQFFYYKPTMEGTYKFQMNFPGQWINTTAYQYWFKPSTSGVVELTVQKEALPAYPEVPLPTDYWTRPVYGENKGWWQVADNWPMRKYDRPSRFFSGDTAFAPYTSAPNSAHILWTKPIIFGGLGGGPFGDKVYYMGLSYEQFYTPIIVNGRIYYVDHGPYSWGDMAGGSIDPFGSMGYGTHCLDLYTGEEIWFLNNTNIVFAQIYDIENPNEHGLIAHLWEVIGSETGMATWRMYDAFTGRYILTIKNVPMHGWRTNAVVFGPSGELLSYVLDAKKDRLILWNSTRALGGYPSNIYYPERYNLIEGAVVNGLRGVQWNVSIPHVQGIPDVSYGNFSIRKISLEDGVILAAWESVFSWSQFVEYPAQIVEVAYPTTINKLANGSYPTSIDPLWVQTRTNIQGRVFYSNNIGDGVYTIFDSPVLKIYGYDVKTGQQLWVTELVTELTSTTGWAYYTYMHHIAYGKLYTLGYDGYMRAFDIKTGKLAWEYFLGSAGYETPYGTWPSYTGFTIADGKIYATNDDHSPDSVPWRGGKLWVFNATTGDLIWSISGWLRNVAVSDGYATALNSLDGKIYTFGKGPSSTIVEAPLVAVPLGSTLVIRGKVLDESPGQRGTPAVARESMAAWMEYLHMQKPVPAEVKGVPVELYSIYPDGSYKYIDTVTTDPLAGGVYGLAWTPPEEGTYTIIAVFRGDESYGSSSAGTIIHVTAAPPESATAQQAETMQSTLQGAIEALQPWNMVLTVLVAIAIVIGIVNLYALRKRK